MVEHTLRWEYAQTIAQEAANIILRYYQRPDLIIDSKADASPVTQADREAEEWLRVRIEERFPTDGILGEEFPEKTSQSGFRWILDPLDGTKSFIHGVPLFGTLIGIEEDGDCFSGICNFPALQECIHACRGHGAWWMRRAYPPQRAQVSRVTDLRKTTLCYTDMSRWEKSSYRDALHMIINKVGLLRGWGDCYGHMLVATGRAELMLDPELNPWDAAPLLPILQEAGGVFVDFAGRPTIYGGHGMSLVPGIKDEIFRLFHHP